MIYTNHDEINEKEVAPDYQENTEASAGDETAGSSNEDQALAACQRETDMWKDRCQRMGADLENMRRRMAKDHEASLIAAQSDVFNDLLAVVDNFDRALSDQKIMSDNACKSWVEGIQLIRKELAHVLSSYGVEEIIETHTFDPEIHEALAQVDAPDHESGTIVTVLQKGYRFKGRVLRHAKVTVAR